MLCKQKKKHKLINIARQMINAKQNISMYCVYNSLKLWEQSSATSIVFVTLYYSFWS